MGRICCSCTQRVVTTDEETMNTQSNLFRRITAVSVKSMPLSTLAKFLPGVTKCHETRVGRWWESVPKSRSQLEHAPTSCIDEHQRKCTNCIEMLVFGQTWQTRQIVHSQHIGQDNNMENQAGAKGFTILISYLHCTQKWHPRLFSG